MIRPLLFLLVALICASAQRFGVYEQRMGAVALVVLKDESRPYDRFTAHATTETSETATELFAVGLDDGVGADDGLTCVEVVTKQVPVVPRGCDALSASEAVVDHFCEFGGSLALQSAAERLLEQWTLSPDSPQCTDKAACLGPVYSSSQGWDYDEPISDRVLLRSREGLYIRSAAGPAGEIPMITFVPVRMPRLALNLSTCPGYEDDMEFELASRDALEANGVVNTTFVYASDLVRRLRLVRENAGVFRIALGTRGNGAEFYNDRFLSVDTFASLEDFIDAREVAFAPYVAPTPAPTTPQPTTLAPSRQPTTLRPTTLQPSTLAPTPQPSTLRPSTLAPTAQPTTSAAPSLAPTGAPSLAPSNAPTATCTAYVGIAPAPRPFEMVAPPVPDDLTYYLDTSGAFVTRECARRRGAYTEINDLVHANAANNRVLGGRVRMRAPGPFGPKYRVEKQYEFRDFVDDCTKFYPRAAQFDTAGGASVSRDAPDLQACNFPFPFPQAVQDKADDVFEKMRQCQMVGGRTALASKAYCTADLSTTLCRRGWHFFDQFCYYRPDPDRDARFKVRQADADDACRALHPAARAASNIDAYTESWLRTSFIFHTPVACGSDPVRAPVTGTRCKCYDCPAVLGNASAALDGAVTECGCERPEFPLCFYRIKDDYIAWNDMVFDPRTLRTLRDGQCMDPLESECTGLERHGAELECDCVPGSAPPDCVRSVCIANASALVGNDPLLRFAQMCEKHGACDDDNPDACACLLGYGPPAVFGGPFSAFPCSLPMTREPRDPDAGFLFNGTLFEYAYGVCNGASAGEGFCDPATRLCWCACRDRINMDPDGEGIEPAYDGVGCTAPTPMLPADGFQINGGIVERLCNGRGTVCPSGERLGAQQLDGSYVVVVDSDLCRGKPAGCACDNGFAGASCTVPVPYDEAARKPTHVTNGAYVPIRGGRHPVMNVVVRAEAAYAGVEPACTALVVYVSDTTLESETLCTRTDDEGRWWCAGAFGSYVVVNASETRPSCAIQVFTENDAPCGNFTNPFMGRLFANAVYRDFNRTDEFQSMTWSTHGGTNTECGCDPDHTGPLCRTQISGKRYDLDGAVSSRVCGESTFPPRGIVGTDGRCQCLRIGPFDFAGSPACACATTEAGMCGGVGVCRAPQFAYGRCEFDIAAAARDALSTPFTRVVPPFVVPNITYVVVSNETVMEFGGRSWLVSRGQTFAIETARGNLSAAYDNARFPLNITHECGQPEDVPGPVRAIANVTIVYLECFLDEYEAQVCTPFNYTQLCDPAWNCDAPRFCRDQGAEFPCLEVNEWMPDDDEDGDLLPSRRYTNVRLTLGYLSPTQTQEDRDFPYGVFDTCADPVLRWLDAGLEGARMVERRQCTDGFALHDNTKGQVFGVFDDVIPGLDFRALDRWTDDHYAFLASVHDRGTACVDARGKHVEDVLTDAVMNAYLLSIVRGAGEETRVELGTWGAGALLPGAFNASRLTTDAAAWWGNFYWHVDTALSYGPETRWGGYVMLPKGQGEVRRVTVRNGGNATIRALALVGPRGATCLTRLEALRPNETFTVDCGAAFESEPEVASMRRLWDSNRTELAPNLTAWYSPYVMLYSADAKVELRESDIAYTSRATSYADRWRSISAAIQSERVWPPNAPYLAACARRGGYTRAYDIQSADDRAFLRRVHQAHLGPARCTHDWQCKRFAKRPEDGMRCVPDDSLPAEGWLNGDAATGDDGVSGVEGGCDCRGARSIADPQFHCTRCVAGYEAPWSSVVQFELETRARLANFSDAPEIALYNASEWADGVPPVCTIPSAQAPGRPTTACGGGRGRLVRDAYSRTSNVTLYGDNKIKRCEAVTYEAERFDAVPNEAELDVHAFVSESRSINVVQGRAFLDGATELFSGVTCVERASSATHRVLSRIGNATFALQRRDPWTNFVLFV